jgi:hypothetical protein
MGRVRSPHARLDAGQLERIEALAQRLLEQTLARSVMVTILGGQVIALVGDADAGEGLESYSEKVGDRLRVQVRFDDTTSLGLVRLRLRHFADELGRAVTSDPH